MFLSPFLFVFVSQQQLTNFQNILGEHDSVVGLSPPNTRGIYKIYTDRPRIPHREDKANKLSTLFTLGYIGMIFEKQKTSLDLIKCDTQIFLSEPSSKKLVP
jgi:hypothetical protein